MKFGTPILTTELSGSLNGITASRARGGIGYFRTRVTPSNPRTYLQTVIRAILSGVAAAWRLTLTTPQRAAWTAIAKTGESGIDRFTAANTQVMLGGSARVDAAPTSADLAWTSIPLSSQMLIGVSSGPNTIGINHAGNGILAAGKLNFFLQSMVQPASRLFPVGNMEFVGTFDIAGTAHPTLNISDFLDTHPDYVSGGKAYMGVVGFKTTGEVTQRVQALIEIT